MGRNNGTFRYILPSEHVRDEETGFIKRNQQSNAGLWVDGCECQVEKSIPAKQYIGADGQAFLYTYDVFIPPYFDKELCIGAKVEVTVERGGVDVFTILGIDDTNRKYIEIWG